MEIEKTDKLSGSCREAIRHFEKLSRSCLGSWLGAVRELPIGVVLIFGALSKFAETGRLSGAIILPVVLGQHRGRGPEYQLEEIVPRCTNIEKSVLYVRYKTL